MVDIRLGTMYFFFCQCNFETLNMSIIRSSRNPRLPQLQLLSARYIISSKNLLSLSLLTRTQDTLCSHQLPSPTPHPVTFPAHTHFLLPSTLPPFLTEPDLGYAADNK